MQNLLVDVCVVILYDSLMDLLCCYYVASLAGLGASDLSGERKT